MNQLLKRQYFRYENNPKPNSNEMLCFALEFDTNFPP